MAAQQLYEGVKAAKEAEIKAGEEQRDAKTQELADTDAKLAEDKQDLEDTRNSLSADQKFLMNLKETCQMTDQARASSAEPPQPLAAESQGARYFALGFYFGTATPPLPPPTRTG